ncbi:MAG: rubrerythrin family protein [Planctomycetes bacterium]|nr:rubrerythrin family protein [Planctomycetota bacterium]
MATEDNLKEAFAGESQANRRYLAFAKKADAEGKPGIARLFRAAAAAETVHAHAHLRVLGSVKSTVENLKAAVEGESYEFKTMYPDFAKEAQAEGNKAALASIQNAMAVERVHCGLFSDAAKALAEGKDMPDKTIYVCSICGNTIIGDAPDTCPVCGAGKDRFDPVE